jgi:hypothetical protein
MLEGIGDGCPELVPENSKLRLACEVYLSSHFEATPTATFLNLINTLEILVEDASSSESIKTMVQRFIVEAKTAEKGATSPEIRSEYHSLVSRLSYLRHRSIKSGIRSLIENGLQTDSSSKKAVEIAGEISRLYDLRSDLVHSGDVDKKDIANGNKRLNEVVPSILRVFFRRTAQRE